MNPATIRRFPLVARPRPACTPLPQRVTGLQQRAGRAHDTGDVAAATAVFNLAALLASDCGVPDLARTWCHRLARTALRTDRDPRHGLEPVVNLARLHIRAGNGAAAWTLLHTLFHAIDTRTDTIIDGLTIPASHIAADPSAHHRTRAWLWTVLLGTGAHALAVDGRWDHAIQRLTHYNGIGNRMLDGRQLTVIAHAIAGRRHHARATVDATQPGETWENAVTACLSLLLADDTPPDRRTVDIAAYLDRSSQENGLALFHTRLGLTLLDALGPRLPQAHQIAAGLIAYAARDGYAARDILTHRACLSAASQQQTHQLATLVETCGLDTGTVPEPQLNQLLAVLDTAELTIARP
ncbi:hypothetical protein [Micromonospora sp. WMMD1082]|uniref:hypothetical protein n=1 Tax=Micromonospora sp. WMMD1082 TaxID=3016104 RepID=UPI002417DD74|nr:hypothetical protein [Micromonospora sp. WMMD1082]MDG4795154.1 hypothetical protein [Micromonospora sp. WMMD1082]